MKVIEFIKQNENWRDLLTKSPYNLKIKDEDDLTILSYTHATKFSEDISCECRGLIIDREFNIVCRKFDKFFNWIEPHISRAEILYQMLKFKSNLKFYEKMDGSIVSLYYYKNEWRLCSNNTIDARTTFINDGKISMFDIFQKVLQYMKISWTELQTKLDKNKCYIFELVSQNNIVVIDYGFERIYLIGVRDLNTQLEENIEKYITLGFPLPTQFNFPSLDAGIEYVLNMRELNSEGLIAVDDQFNRVKIKNRNYINVSGILIGYNLTTWLSTINLIRSNYDLVKDMIEQYYPTIKNKILEYEKLIEIESINISNIYHKIIDKIGNMSDDRMFKKLFSQKLDEYGVCGFYRPILYLIRDDKYGHKSHDIEMWLKNEVKAEVLNDYLMSL